MAGIETYGGLVRLPAIHVKRSSSGFAVFSELKIIVRKSLGLVAKPTYGMRSPSLNPELSGMIQIRLRIVKDQRI